MNRLPVAPHGLILSVGGAVDARMLLRPVLDQCHVKILIFEWIWVLGGGVQDSGPIFLFWSYSGSMKPRVVATCQALGCSQPAAIAGGCSENRARGRQ